MMTKHVALTLVMVGCAGPATSSKPTLSTSQTAAQTYVVLSNAPPDTITKVNAAVPGVDGCKIDKPLYQFGTSDVVDATCNGSVIKFIHPAGSTTVSAACEAAVVDPGKCEAIFQLALSRAGIVATTAPKKAEDPTKDPRWNK